VPGIEKTIGTSLDQAAEQNKLGQLHSNDPAAAADLIDRAAKGEKVNLPRGF
jgi:hypothetical protein